MLCYFKTNRGILTSPQGISIQTQIRQGQYSKRWCSWQAGQQDKPLTGLFSLHILCMRKSCKYIYLIISSGLSMRFVLMTMALKQCGGYHVRVASLTATEAAFPTHLPSSVCSQQRSGGLQESTFKSCPLFSSQSYVPNLSHPAQRLTGGCPGLLNHCCQTF